MISFEDAGIESQGHKFGIPELPLQSNANIKHRYDPVIHQVTNLLMRDGKLSVAQRVWLSVPLGFHSRSFTAQHKDADIYGRTWL